ncbi:trypsin-like serine peptidase [Sorangium sp. So ce1078]|uniref:trypsin-like serine peptidase n=1 Tax=Sorangium sp. So ce1078 TaxID=3133329 RepID=UPI003F622FA3
MGDSKKEHSDERLVEPGLGTADPEDPEAPRLVLERLLTIPPYPAICALDIDFGPGHPSCPGTGWFIDPRVMVTAGHCLYNGSFAQSISIYDTDGTKVAHVTPSRDNGGASPPHPPNFFIERSWYNHLDAGASKHDYGAILLKPTDIIGEDQRQHSTIPYTFVEDTELDGAEVTIAGYPRTEPRRMHSDTKKLIRCEETLMFYNAGTIKGQSGSPICVYRGGQQLCGVGIHTGSSAKVGRPQVSSNVGIRITRELEDVLRSLVRAVELGNSDDWVNERWERG